MSLFPAYASVDPSPQEDENIPSSSQEGPETAANDEETKMDWLENSSFVPAPDSVSVGASTSEQEGVKKRKRKKKKDKIFKRKRRSSEEESSDSECFFVIDNVGDQSLSSPNEGPSSRPDVKADAPKKKKKKKKKKKQTERYFSEFKEDALEKEEEGNQLTAMEAEEYFKKTENFNIKLRDNPNDEECWLEYIRHQDKGEGTKKCIAEKKLSIMDKALSENPGSEMLLDEKFAISEKIFPTDKIAEDAKALLSKDSSNMVGWQWLIKCNQFTLSRMTVPKVLDTYSSALKGFHKLNRNTHKMLETVLQCGLFLRQAGLWEYLWAFIEHYLELNLAVPGSKAFKTAVSLPEAQIRDIEDTIVTCGLPLGALWLRIEHLRESVQFLPVNTGEDPQRIIFPEDVSNLVFPVKKAVTGRLIAVMLALLKVPPLPSTDSFNDFIGLKSTPWAYETTEFLLAAVHHTGIVHMGTKYVTVAKELVVGPQYLIEKLGKVEFYRFVDAIFENCVKHGEREDVEAIFVWRMRWLRFCAKVQGFLGKGAKEVRTKVKRLLKERRDSLPLFIEYAQLEREVGNTETTVRVLDTAVSHRSPPLTTVRDKANLCYLYRTYVEILLLTDLTSNRERVLKVLMGLALAKSVNSVGLNDENIEKATEKFGHLTVEMTSELRQNDEVKLSDLLVPNIAVSWLACHVWFLYLTQSVWESAAVVERAISSIHVDTQRTLGRCVLENFYEILVNVMHHFCVNNPGHFKVLDEVLERATKLFPDNLHFSNVVASTEKCASLMKYLKDPHLSALANIFNIFFIRDKMLKVESQEAGGAKSSGLHSKMYNLLKRLSIEPQTEMCPLVWRLVLQFVSMENPTEVKKHFFQAAEKCPWVKTIYYGAAQVLPEELGQIQDLLVEKELRLHITPEEIEILREEVKMEPPQPQPSLC